MNPNQYIEQKTHDDDIKMARCKLAVSNAQKKHNSNSMRYHFIPAH